MKGKHTLVFLFILIHTVSFSQGEFIVEIDRTDGTFIKTGPVPIAGITWIYPNDRAFDESTGTFIFPSSRVDHRLYSINTSNGSIVNNPLINNLKAFQFDNTTDILYGLEPDNASSTKSFISIVPSTGVSTPIGNPLPGSATFSGNFSTFDEINHTYIFLDPPKLLTSINAANGNVMLNPRLQLVSGESVVNFSFDNSATPPGILYGLLKDRYLGLYFLITINPTTGTITRKGSGTPFGSGNGSATIDESNQQYIYMYSSSTAGGYAITTLDIASGNLVFNALIGPFTNKDNFHSLKYDRTQGRLFSIHWENITVGVEIAIDIKPQSCPNPLNTKSKGVLPVAILGSADLDVNNINVSSILLEGVAPIRSSVEDVSTPVVDGEECECTTDGADGFDDLTLKFDTQDIVATLGTVNDGDQEVLTLTGNLIDGTAIEGMDCVIIKSKGKRLNKLASTDLPESFSLEQNYPNPFNPETKINYSVSHTSYVILKVYDMLGNEITTLVNEAKPVGTYEITWYAENLPSGMYFYRLQAGDFVETKKMILLR